MSDQTPTLYIKCLGDRSECRDGNPHLSHDLPVERCEHGNIDPHWDELPYGRDPGFWCEGSPTLKAVSDG